MEKEIPFWEENEDIYFDCKDLRDLDDCTIPNLNYVRPCQKIEIKKYFPAFYGRNGIKGLSIYLNNTAQVTALGIAFAYIMKLKPRVPGVSVGIVKVTSPAHNRVTNNFNHWLIDFIVTPSYRGRGFATNSIKSVLGVVKEMGAKEIFAMVDSENIVSKHVLEKCGFYETHLFDIGYSPYTHNKCLLYRKIF